MKNLKFKIPDYHSEGQYLEDCERIVDVCAKAGYRLSINDAARAWETYSENYFCAGWLILHEDDGELLNAILTVMEPEENNADVQETP